jgi:hypothetical protein
MGNHQVFPWVGNDSQVQLGNGKYVFPMTTGTSGILAVTFLQSMKDKLAAVDEDRTMNSTIDTRLIGHQTSKLRHGEPNKSQKVFTKYKCRFYKIQLPLRIATPIAQR